MISNVNNCRQTIVPWLYFSEVLVNTLLQSEMETFSGNQLHALSVFNHKLLVRIQIQKSLRTNVLHLVFQVCKLAGTRYFQNTLLTFLQKTAVP